MENASGSLNVQTLLEFSIWFVPIRRAQSLLISVSKGYPAQLVTSPIVKLSYEFC